jgi:hypothetical protein
MVVKSQKNQGGEKMRIVGNHIKFEGDDKFFTDTLVGWVGIERFQEICSDTIELKRIIMEMQDADIMAEP